MELEARVRARPAQRQAQCGLQQVLPTARSDLQGARALLPAPHDRLMQSSHRTLRTYQITPLGGWCSVVQPAEARRIVTVCAGLRSVLPPCGGGPFSARGERIRLLPTEMWTRLGALRGSM